MPSCAPRSTAASAWSSSVPPDGVGVALGTLERLGVDAWQVGTVVPVAAAGGARYLESGTTG